MKLAGFSSQELISGSLSMRFRSRAWDSWPGIQYPRVPGHEVVGIIDELGVSVSAWKNGQRVGVGWHGGQDNTCPSYRHGDFAIVGI
jgi:D-arabinose 1-dehydrogenase-like Zn-dependent alcohol dehydrogenase